MVGTLVMAPKSVTFRWHDHLVSVLFGDLLSQSYNVTFSMFLYLVCCSFVAIPMYTGANMNETSRPLKLLLWREAVVHVHRDSPRCCCGQSCWWVCLWGGGCQPYPSSHTCPSAQTPKTLQDMCTNSFKCRVCARSTISDEVVTW